MGIIDDTVAKYAGEDDAYAQKLKEGIRDSMGYSNYKSRLNNESAAVATVGDTSGLSPAGIQAKINSKFRMQDANITHLRGMADTMDDAAGSIASAQISAEKAAKNKVGLENNVLFAPKDSLDVKLLEALQNPYNVNPDGTLGEKKSLQQIEAEVAASFEKKPPVDTNPLGIQYDDTNPLAPKRPYTEQDAANNTPQEYSAEDVNARIAERVPKDYIGNEGKYYFMYKGYSEKTAIENQQMADYPSMSAPLKRAMQYKYPELAKDFESVDEINAAVADANRVQKDEVTGKDVPAATYEDVLSAHPELTPAQAEKYVKPVYIKDANDATGEFLDMPTDGNGKLTVRQELDKIQGDDKNTKAELIKKDLYFRSMADKLEIAYRGVLSRPEIEAMILKQLDTTK